MLARALGLTLAAVTFACSGTPSEIIGSHSDAIIAGETSLADQDAVVLVYQSARNQTCTGTMVAPNLLVTARHCVGALDEDGVVIDHPASAVRVFVGANALASLRDDEAHPAAKGATLVVPESRSFYPDVAFVVLDRALDTPVAAMRLASGVAKGETVGVIGYGLDETGKRPAARMQRGGLVVTQIGPGRSSIGERLDKGELVFGEAACSGDSGGPAFSGTTGALVAIASRVGNGTTPSADEPAGFCVGDATNDVYTDLTPVADVATRAFAAAHASPVLEDSIAPAKEGELASAHVDGTNAGTTPISGAADADGGGCTVTTARASNASSSAVGALVLALVLVSASRRCRSSSECRRSASR